MSLSQKMCNLQQKKKQNKTQKTKTKKNDSLSQALIVYAAPHWRLLQEIRSQFLSTQIIITNICMEYPSQDKTLLYLFVG